MEIRSKIQPDKILHHIVRGFDIQRGRVDIVSPENRIQVAAIKEEQGRTYQPHFHIPRLTPESRQETQEAWIVLKGNIKVEYYDLDKTIIHTDVLVPGDITITLAGGGHNYTWLTDGFVYEIKSGPYSGQVNDKEFI